MYTTDRATLSNARASANCLFACTTSRCTMRISRRSDRALSALSPEICIWPKIAKRQFSNRSASFRRVRVAIWTENRRTKPVYCKYKYLLRKRNTCSEFAVTAPIYLSSRELGAGCANSDFFRSIFCRDIEFALTFSSVLCPGAVHTPRTAHAPLRSLVVIHQSFFVGRRRATVDNSRSRPA